MRKYAFIILCASALLSLGSCADNDATREKVTNPVPPSVDNGMVTFGLSVSGGSYTNGNVRTRIVPARPAQYVQEVGDDFVLVSELTATPITRAASGGTPLEAGRKVLVLVFDDNDANLNAGDSTVIGYQQLAVNERNHLNISLPESETPYRLLLYTENGTANFDVDQFVDTSSFTLLDADKGYYEGSGSLRRKAVSFAGEAGSQIPADAMYALLDNVSADPDSPSIPEAATLHHPFAQLTWTLEVNPNSAIGESIGAIDAAFYPRYSSATLNLGRVAVANNPDDIDPQATWSGGTLTTAQAPGSLFAYTATGSEKKYVYEESVRFVPATNSTLPSTLVINSITFNTNKAEPATLTDNAYPIKAIADDDALVFQPGMKYTVTSKLTKKDYFLSKRVLPVTSSPGTYGYAGDSGASGLFLQSLSNFSLTGTVPVNGLTIDTALDPPSQDISSFAPLADALTAGTPPDIVIFGEPCYWDSVSTTSRAILDYLNGGGVVIMFYGGGTSALANGGLLKATDYKLSLTSTVTLADGSSYLMNGGDVASDDPIMTGVIDDVSYYFKTTTDGSSVAGKYWGIGATTIQRFEIKSGSESDFAVYSVHPNPNIDPPAEGYKPTMLRYKHKNFLLVGDRQFLEGPAAGSTSTNSNPFAINLTEIDAKGRNTYRAASKNYGAYGITRPVDNSWIFGNIMAWAIYQAEHHGINTENEE